MKHTMTKAARFAWRAARNLLCVTPWGKRRLFPAQALANRFGRGDAEYALNVFLHHYRQLSAAGFHAVDKILEVGPGRNAGTALAGDGRNRNPLGRLSEHGRLCRDLKGGRPRPT